MANFNRFVLLSVMLVLAAGMDPASAMGKKKKSPGGGFDFVETITLNPYIMTLVKEFNNAIKPTHIDTEGRVLIGDNIEMGKRYDCRVFYALSRNDAVVAPEGRSWYQFKRFGDLFLDNLSFSDNGRIKTFAPNVAIENELWGQSFDKNYYEAIRVTKTGDLIIEAFAPKMAWARSILGILGLDNLIDYFLPKLQGLAIPTMIAGANGYIISYSYCPHDNAGTMKLEQLLNSYSLE
ncbi:MAG: hypothetical protein AABZ06_11100 [Bdellovibrionota bacterium]